MPLCPSACWHVHMGWRHSQARGSTLMLAVRFGDSWGFTAGG